MTKVVIREIETEAIIREIQCEGENSALKVERGVNINLNQEVYYTSIEL